MAHDSGPGTVVIICQGPRDCSSIMQIMGNSDEEIKAIETSPAQSGDNPFNARESSSCAA